MGKHFILLLGKYEYKPVEEWRSIQKSLDRYHSWKAMATGFILLVVLLSISTTVKAADDINLVKNPSFETDPCIEYFTYPEPCNEEPYAWATDQKHSGKKSIKIDSQKAGDSLSRWLTRNDTLDITEGHTYDVSLWFKSFDVKKHAELTVNFWGPNKNDFIGQNGRSSATILGTEDWQERRVRVVAPLGARFMRVEAHLYGEGTIWADDIFVGDASRNLFSNPGFEDDPKTDLITLATDFTKNTFIHASDEMHSGDRSISIVSNQSYGEFSGWLSKNNAVEVIESEKYLIEGWIKTKDVDGRAEIAANFWGPGSTDRILLNGKTSDPIKGVSGWRQIRFTVTAPINARYLKTEHRIFGSGTVWFDDVSVRNVSTLPIYEASPVGEEQPVPDSPPKQGPPAVSSSAPQPQPIAESITINRKMIIGTQGQDVLMLQKYLNSMGFKLADSGPGSPGNETTYFGPVTREAIRKFQCAKIQVCSGDEYSTGYGVVGPRTRATLSK